MPFRMKWVVYGRHLQTRKSKNQALPLQTIMQPALDQTRSYSLHTPDREQSTPDSSTQILQTRTKLEPSDESQVKVCTLLTLQFVSSGQEPSCGLHPSDRNLQFQPNCPDRGQVMACILQKGTSYSQWLGPSNGSQLTAYILQTLAPASAQVVPSYNHQMGTNFTTDTSHASYTIFSTLQSASSGQEPSYNLHSFTACLCTSDRDQDTTRTMLQPPTYQF